MALYEQMMMAPDYGHEDTVHSDDPWDFQTRTKEDVIYEVQDFLNSYPDLKDYSIIVWKENGIFRTEFHVYDDDYVERNNEG